MVYNSKMTSELDLSNDNLVRRLFESGELQRIRENQPWMIALRERTRRSWAAVQVGETDFFMRAWDENVPTIAKNELEQILSLVAEERRIPIIRRLFYVTAPITEPRALGAFERVWNWRIHFFRHDGEKVGIIARCHNGIFLMVGYVDASSHTNAYLMEVSVVGIYGRPISVTPMGLRFFTESQIDLRHVITVRHTYYTILAAYVIGENELTPIV